MAKIYISSTYGDLKDYREKVYRTLNQWGHQVIAMEDYVASDQRPLDKCLEDVAGCNLYVGVFAWRYGYVPDRDNPARLSITELECRKAGEIGLPRLIFLLADDAPWPSTLNEAISDPTGGGRRILALLDGLTAGMMRTDKHLSPTEVFVLLATATLHDIGMQNERFAGGSLDDIRAHHHEQTAEMIYAVFEDPANAFPIPLANDPGLVEAVALVAKGRRV